MREEDRLDFRRLQPYQRAQHVRDDPLVLVLQQLVSLGSDLRRQRRERVGQRRTAHPVPVDLEPGQDQREVVGIDGGGRADRRRARSAGQSSVIRSWTIGS